MKSINILLIQICFLLYMTSFCNSRSFKDLALLSALLDYDFFFLGILAERRQLNWRRLLLLKSYYSVNVFNTKKRPKLGQNITNVGFHDKPLIFFYFCDLDFIDYCLNFGCGRNGGSRAQPGHQVVPIFYFCLPWIPPKFQFFLPPFSWIPPKIPTIIN